MSIDHAKYVASELNRMITDAKIPDLASAWPGGIYGQTASSPTAVAIRQTGGSPSIVDLGGTYATQNAKFSWTVTDTPVGRMMEKTIFFEDTIEEGDIIQLEINGVTYAITASTLTLIGSTTKRLVAIERNTSNPDGGRFVALPIQSSAGLLPLPIFKIVDNLPPTGRVSGEACFSLKDNQAFVWNGNAWAEITRSPKITYPNLAALYADTTRPSGSYASVMGDSRLFLKSGADWVTLGSIQYATYADLIADANQIEGTVGIVEDEDSVWLKTSSGWVVTTKRHLVNRAAMNAWTTASNGTTVVTQDKHLEYIHSNGAWIPIDIWHDTEANLLLDLDHEPGQMAVTTDSSHTFFFDGTGWIGSKIQHFMRESDLLAKTPTDGVLAWAEDTSMIYVRSNGQWNLTNQYMISFGESPPTTSPNINLWWDTSTGGLGLLRRWNGTEWIPVGMRIIEAKADISNYKKYNSFGFTYVHKVNADDREIYVHNQNPGDWVNILHSKSKRNNLLAIKNSDIPAHGNQETYLDMQSIGYAPERWIRLSSVFKAGGTAASIGLIVQKLDGNWIDWTRCIDASLIHLNSTGPEKLLYNDILSSNFMNATMGVKLAKDNIAAANNFVYIKVNVFFNEQKTCVLTDLTTTDEHWRGQFYFNGADPESKFRTIGIKGSTAMSGMYFNVSWR